MTARTNSDFLEIYLAARQELDRVRMLAIRENDGKSFNSGLNDEFHSIFRILDKLQRIGTELDIRDKNWSEDYDSLLRKEQAARSFVPHHIRFFKYEKDWEERCEWCRENFIGKWETFDTGMSVNFYVKDEADAASYRLRWG